MYELVPPLYNDGGKAYVETETIHQQVLSKYWTNTRMLE